MIEVGKRYGLAVIKKEIMIQQGSRRRSGYEITCACGTTFQRDASGTRSAINLGDGLWCQSCAQINRRAKQEGRELMYQDTDGSIIGHRYDKEKLKSLQNWGYSPR